MVNTISDTSTEEKILNAAREVFFQKGFSGARMQDIADEAGINKALLHYYFRSKEKLFETIFREAFEKLVPRIIEVFSSKLPFFEKIRAFCEAYITMAIENPFIPIFILNEMHRNPEGFKKTFGDIPKKLPHTLLKSVIKKAMDDGLIREIDPLQLIMNMLSLCMFPTISRPMFQLVMNMSDMQFKKMNELRKKEVADFIIQAIKK
ncbi:MAG: TetR family transcriptional regulator [Chitinophagaceae bacterium]